MAEANAAAGTEGMAADFGAGLLLEADVVVVVLGLVPEFELSVVCTVFQAARLGSAESKTGLVVVVCSDYVEGERQEQVTAAAAAVELGADSFQEF